MPKAKATDPQPGSALSGSQFHPCCVAADVTPLACLPQSCLAPLPFSRGIIMPRYFLHTLCCGPFGCARRGTVQAGKSEQSASAPTAMCAVLTSGADLPAPAPAAADASPALGSPAAGASAQLSACCKGAQQDHAVSILVMPSSPAAPAPSRRSTTHDDAAATCSSTSSGGDASSSPLSAATPRAFGWCKVSSPQPCSKVTGEEERAPGTTCHSMPPVRVSLPPKVPRHPSAAVGNAVERGGALKVGQASEVPAPQPVTPSSAAAAATAAHAPAAATQPSPDIPLLASAVAASKLGLVDQLTSALGSSSAVAVAR